MVKESIAERNKRKEKEVDKIKGREENALIGLGKMFPKEEKK